VPSSTLAPAPPAHFLASRDRWDASVAVFGREVSDVVGRAVAAFAAGDAPGARTAAQEADRLAERGRRLDEDGLKVLALYRPVGRDLRALAAVQKAVRSLVGAGDLAAKIAAAAGDESPAGLPAALPLLAERARAMLEAALESLVRRDADAARRVLAGRGEAAVLRAQATADLQRAMSARPERLAAGLRAVAVVDALDRIARRALHVAEDVVYLVEETVLRRVC
jgi:phosphate transport system protein